MPDGAIANINGARLLRPPPQLSPDERRVFAEVVSSARSGHFEQSDLALLVEFSRTTLLVQALWAVLNAAAPEDKLSALTALGKAQKTLFQCCRLLRLSPSGRTPNPNTRESQRRSASRHPAVPSSIYDTMEVMDEQVEPH